jgi:hypothetical protein
MSRLIYELLISPIKAAKLGGFEPQGADLSTGVWGY